MSPKRLVLLVEGEGDVDAARVLVKRLLKEHSAFDAVSLDEKPLRIRWVLQDSKKRQILQESRT